MAVSSETIFAFYPLLAFTPPPSGLGLSPSTIGFHMATRSALNIVVMCVAAPIQQRIGSVKTFKWGMACIGVAVLALWAVVELEDGVISKVFLAAFLAFWGGGSLVWRRFLFVFTSIFFTDTSATSLVASDPRRVAQVSRGPRTRCGT